jgi:hypothetical protein
MREIGRFRIILGRVVAVCHLRSVLIEKAFDFLLTRSEGIAATLSQYVQLVQIVLQEIGCHFRALKSIADPNRLNVLE